MAIASWPSSVMTTGRFSITAVPKIPACGGTRTGVSSRAPSEPMLVTVKVAPVRSFGFSLLLRARSAKSVRGAHVTQEMGNPPHHRDGSTNDNHDDVDDAVNLLGPFVVVEDVSEVDLAVVAVRQHRG